MPISRFPADTALFIASYAMPADMAPSPMTAMALSGLSASLLATAKPRAALIDVELWAAPKGSYALSARLVNPESPPPCRRVRMRSQIGRAHVSTPVTNAHSVCRLRLEKQTLLPKQP